MVPAETAIPNATTTSMTAGSGKCAGISAASSSTATNTPTTTSDAPRNAHTARGPRTNNTAPITAAYNSNETEPTLNSPMLKCMRFKRPSSRPFSIGAPVSASHQPDRTYVDVHGRFFQGFSIEILHEFVDFSTHVFRSLKGTHAGAELITDCK
jgi:hypothetical protein